MILFRESPLLPSSFSLPLYVAPNSAMAQQGFCDINAYKYAEMPLHTYRQNPHTPRELQLACLPFNALQERAPPPRWSWTSALGKPPFSSSPRC
jgi:hypothetical protein